MKGSSPPTACLTSVALKAIYSINSIWLGVWPWLGAICSAHTLRSLCICRWCVSGVLCLDDGMWVCVGKCCSELPSLSISLLIVAALDKCLCCKKHRNHSSYTCTAIKKKNLRNFFATILNTLYSINANGTLKGTRALTEHNFKTLSFSFVQKRVVANFRTKEFAPCQSMSLELATHKVKL